MVEKVKKFGNVLRQIRTNRNLNLRELAKLCEFSAAYISGLEKTIENQV